MTCRLRRPLLLFARREASSSLLWMAATVAALVWANSDWQNAYRGLRVSLGRRLVES